MVGAVSPIGSYYGNYRYSGIMRVGAAAGTGRVRAMAGVASVSRTQGVQGGASASIAQAQAIRNSGSAAVARQAQTIQGSGALMSQIQAMRGAGTAMVATRAANPGSPVEAVRPVSAINTNERSSLNRAIPFLRKGMDPAEMAVRMRIQYADPTQTKDPQEVGTSKASRQGVAGIQNASEEGECKTCERRKYQDGSDDAGVSFKTPTHIAPEQAAAAVRGHEMEHVVREQAKAEREDRRVVSQSVTMHTSICPECGDVYVSGGTTRTTTAAESQADKGMAGQEKGQKDALASEEV